MKVPKLALIALFVLCMTAMPCFAKAQKKVASNVLPKIGTRVTGAECRNVLKNGSVVVVADVSIIVNGKPRPVRYSVTANETNHLDYLSSVPPSKQPKQFTAMVAFDTRLSIGIRGKLVPGSFRLVKLRPGNDRWSCRIKFAQIVEGKKIVMQIPLQGLAKYTGFGGKSPVSPGSSGSYPSTVSGMSSSSQAPLSTTRWETIIWLNAPAGKVEWTKLSKDEAQKIFR